MDYTSEMIIRTLRSQAWERAKGELVAMLQSYWEREEGHFEQMNAAVEAFIKSVENNGWNE